MPERLKRGKKKVVTRAVVFCEDEVLRNFRAGVIHGTGESEKDSSVQQFLKIYYGEFDSGSERTLAAWIRHASRTE